MAIAIISGNGILPYLIAQESAKQGKKVLIIKIAGQDNPKPSSANHNKSFKINYELKIGNVSQLLQILEKENITEITFAGNIKKPRFSELSVDKEGAKLLAKITSSKIFGDDNVLTAVTKFFNNKGFKVLSTKSILKDDITIKKGVLSQKQPSNEIYKNIKIGQDFIKKISKFDVGQSVAVQQKQIIAIEAIEGTDEMIKRCKSITFSHGEAMLVKMAKTDQNKNIDLPSIGVQTIKNLHHAGFAGLAIEAKNSLVLEKSKVLKLVDKHGIILVGF